MPLIWFLSIFLAFIHNSAIIQFGTFIKWSNLRIAIILFTIYYAFIFKYLSVLFLSNAIVLGELKIGQDQITIEVLRTDPFF